MRVWVEMKNAMSIQNLSEQDYERIKTPVLKVVEGWPVLSEEQFAKAIGPLPEASRITHVEFDAKIESILAALDRMKSMCDAAQREVDHKMGDLLNERAALGRQLEFDRSRVADGVTAIKKALGSREWLTESRGPYEYDDARYQQEFGAAVTEIRQALEPLAKIAGDWTDCPRDTETIAWARLDMEAENIALRLKLLEATTSLSWALDAIDINDQEHPEPREAIRNMRENAKAKAREALK